MKQINTSKPETVNDLIVAELRRMTARELIKHCEKHSEDPIIRELSKRLEFCLDFATKAALGQPDQDYE
jgi:hypothetical protein